MTNAMFRVIFAHETDPSVMQMDVFSSDSGDARQIGNAWLDSHENFPVSYGTLADEGWHVQSVNQV